MRKIRLILLLLLVPASILLGQDTIVMRTKPFLQSPVDNGITVSWLTNYRTLSHVEYGTNKDSLQKVFALQNGQVIANTKLHHVRLNDLKPNTRYYYRVVSKIIYYYGPYKKTFRAQQESEIYSFTSAPEIGEKSDFTAVVFNDLHQKIPTAIAMQEALGDLKYDFVIFNGDCIDDPKDEAQVVNTVAQLNDIVGASQIPVIYLRGNHEIRGAYSIRLYDILKTIAGDRSYGSFSWGDTRLMLLDCGEDKADSHPVYYGMNDFEQFRLDQLGFITEEIETKEFKNASRRLLIHHIPLYGNYSKYAPCRELWGDILNKANIDCAIAAHTHKAAYHSADTLGNAYPVIIGGGPKLETACVTVIKKRGDKLIIEQIADKGEVWETVVL